MKTFRQLLADKSGIYCTYLYRIEHGTANSTITNITVLSAVATAIKAKITDFLMSDVLTAGLSKVIHDPSPSGEKATHRNFSP